MIYLVIFAEIGAAWGWARTAAHHSTATAKTALTVTLVPLLWGGVLSLIGFYGALMGLELHATGSLVVYAVAMVPGWVLAARVGALAPGGSPRRADLAPILVLLAVSGAVIFNALYLPFYRDDALGIYVPFAVELAETGALAPITPTRNLYELYPQLMSFLYAHVYQLAGWANPYVARLVNALLSLAVLPATWALAQEALPDRPLAAPVATILVALTPDVGNWASSGYVDLPMAAYYVAGAVFAGAMIREQRITDLVLAGLCFGLAAWTKNAALAAVGLFFIFVTVSLMNGQLRFNHLLITLSCVAVAAAPWYLRNLVLAGTLTPDTVWTEDARQSLAEIFILLSRPQNYAIPGWVMAAGVSWGLWRGRGLILLYWSLPFYVTWLLFASYDPRFILLILPFWAVLGGLFLADGWRAAHTRMPNRLVVPAVWVLMSVLTLSVMWDSVEYKRAILNNPDMTHTEKLELVE
ncbi:MAG: hypothetical protein AAF125_08370 [Chloroflexota bacterium]